MERERVDTGILVFRSRACKHTYIYRPRPFPPTPHMYIVKRDGINIKALSGLGTGEANRQPHFPVPVWKTDDVVTEDILRLFFGRTRSRSMAPDTQSRNRDVRPKNCGAANGMIHRVRP
jgi:hypothetical protein